MQFDKIRNTILDALVSIEALDPAAAEAARADAGQDIIFSSLGIDSVMVMDFCVLIEDSIGREIEIVELVDNASLNKLARHLEAE